MVCHHSFWLCVYNCPKSSHEKQLLDHLAHTTTLLKARCQNSGFIVCGDLNKAMISEVDDRQLRNEVQVATLGATCLDLISYHQYCKLLKRRHKHLPTGRSDYMSATWKPEHRSQISVPAARTVIINTPAPTLGCVCLASG